MFGLTFVSGPWGGVIFIIILMRGACVVREILTRCQTKLCELPYPNTELVLFIVVSRASNHLLYIVRHIPDQNDSKTPAHHYEYPPPSIYLSPILCYTRYIALTRILIQGHSQYLDRRRKWLSTFFLEKCFCQNMCYG